MKTNLIVLCLIVCGGLARAQVQIDNIPDVPAVLYVTNYDQSSEYDVNGYWGTIFQYTNVWLSWGNDTHDKYTFDWTDGQGGTMVFNDNYTQWQGDTSGYGSAGYTNVWPATEWPVLTNGCEQYSYTAQEGDDPPESDSWTWTTGYPPIAYESCESRVRVNWADFTDIWPDGSGVAYGGNSTYHRHAQTEMRLRTGGRPGGSNRQNLFCLSATAEQWRLVTEQDLNAVYELKEVIDVGPVPAPNITIRGKPLDSYGNLWVVLPDNQDLDVTPQAKGVDFYTFTEPTPSKQCAPMRLDFSDRPFVFTNEFSTSGYCGSFTLQAVCRWGWGTNDWYPLATFSWGYDVDTNGQQHPHQYTANSGCGTIIVDSLTNYFNNTYYTNTIYHGPGIHLMAHYIGCCDGGELNWVQSYTEYRNGVLAATNKPDPGSNPPYYFNQSEIITNLFDYTDYTDWFNGSCP